MADVWELASLDLVFLCSTFWSSVLAFVMTAALGSTSLGCAALRLLWHQALNRHEVVVKKKKNKKTVQQVRKKKDCETGIPVYGVTFKPVVTSYSYVLLLYLTPSFIFVS